MGIYGKAAAVAVDLLRSGATTPRAAWDSAIRQVTGSGHSQSKGCPRAAFLSLCEVGAIEGVAPGTYTSSAKNKGDILRAMDALRSDARLLETRSRLWDVATKGIEKEQNGQLDVLEGLWRAGLLR